MGAENVFSKNKNRGNFKKSETSRLIQLTTNHFLSASYKKRRGNQIEDLYTSAKRRA
jgi:hypothetical protein